MKHSPPGTIRLLTLDVDGVLTDGGIWIDDDGRESKRFHVHDGFALRLWSRTGRALAIITGRSSRVVTHRAAELGIAHVKQGCRDKVAAMHEVRALVGASVEQTAHIGDDLVDLALLRSVGYPIVVADAAKRLKSAAAYVTKAPGGHGAVREAIEHLLREAGELDSLEAEYEKA